MALTKITSAIIADGAITASAITDTSITADKLHTTLDLTGKAVTVATATAGDNDTTVASTAFVSTAIANLADSAPETLNTLNELAAALGDDANFSTTVTNSIALKAPLASPTFTGTLTASGLAYPTADGTNGQVLTTDGSGTLSFSTVSGTTINNNADNRIITGSGTANTLNGESTLTFDGSNLNLNTTSPTLTIESGDSQDSKILFREDGGSAVSLFYEGSAGTGQSNNLHIRRELSGSETNLVTVGLDGNVGIGTDNPAEMLNIETDSGSPAVLVKAAGQTSSTSPTASLILSNGSLSSNDSAPAVYSYRTADYSVTALRSSGLKFQTTKANAAVTAMTIDDNGNVGIGTANPVSAGSGTKSLHVSAQGEARLVLSGDSNNIGDTGQLDVAIYMLTDGGVSTDPFGDTSSTNAGAHGYSFRVKNYAGVTKFDMMEEAQGTTTNMMHMNTAGDVVLGYGSTSVSAGAKFEVASTTSMVIPKGTTAQRPASAVSGALRFNTSTSAGEFYDGTNWKSIGYGNYEAEWLVVAGGGSGGDCTSPARHGGGGGAGGLRTSFGSTSGGGASAEANMIIRSGTVYTITVGGGGASIGNSANTPGNSGSNSSIAGSGLNTITSLGGGGGGGNEADGSSGGSGGGGKESDGAGQAGTSGQGYAGGTGSEGGDRGGGGGGAGGVGTGTNGGPGLAVSITGSSVTYAGGGASSGTGGAGGGGNPGSAGTANTGGGGGSAGSISGAGGSGVVILRVPTASYSGTVTGSPTVTTTGTDTVIKFTSSGTYTG